MRTIEEFAAVCRACDRRAARLAISPAACGLLGAVAGVMVAMPVGRWLDGLFGNQWVGMAPLFYIPLVPLAAAAAGWRWLANRVARRVPGAVCPGCDRLLAGLWSSRQRVVATRHCPDCRARVLADPGPAVPGVTLRTLDEVESVERRFGRRALRWMLVGFAGPAVFMAVLAGLDAVAGGNGLAEDGSLAEWLLVALILAVMLGLPAVSVTTVLVLARRFDRNPVVRCPHCGGRLSVELLRDTGNCGHCGRRAVALPDPPPAG